MITGAAAMIARHVGEPVGRLVLGWLVWFWRLSVVGKLTVTVIEIVVLYLVTLRLPMSPATQHGVIDAGAIGLVLLCVFAVLFASVQR